MKGVVRTLAAICAFVLSAQTPDHPLTFEVASVKVADPGSGPFGVGSSGGPGTSDPGQFTARNMTLIALLTRAYDVPSFRVSGPSWLYTERFNIIAKVPDGATSGQLQAMLRNLLAERFKLVTHKESRPTPVLALVIDNGGLKMKEHPTSVEPQDDSPFPPGGPPLDKDGFPIIPPNKKGVWINFHGDRFLIQVHQGTIADLAELLTGQLNRPVTDDTGLKGQYDFNLEFSAVQVAFDDGSESGSAPTIFNAVRRLGLKLNPGKAPLDTVVVDRIEKTPTEN